MSSLPLPDTGVVVDVEFVWIVEEEFSFWIGGAMRICGVRRGSGEPFEGLMLMAWSRG